ncbi:MAG: TolC family protein [Aphanocapsa lilacina HA4352-LM1]|nr:TolC family protein [Aphanocapsa lilacina HA4352-LM1]
MRRWVVGMVLALLLPKVAAAQVLELEQAFELALLKSPQATALGRRLAVSEAAVLVAGAVPNPSIGATFESAGAENRSNVPFIEQTFELGGKRDARLAVADGQVALTRVEIAEALRELRAQVRRAYAELLVVRAGFEALQEVAAAGERLAAAAAQRFRLGDIPELDLIRARQELALAQNELQLARSREAAARIQLNTLIGRAPEAALTVPTVAQFSLRVENDSLLPSDNLPSNERERKLRDLIALALANRADLQVLGGQMALAGAERRLAEAERAPDLRVGAGPRLSFDETLQVGAAAAVNVSLPLWYAQQGQIARAEATTRQLETEREVLVARIKAEVESAFVRVLSAREQQQIYEQGLLPTARTVEQTARLAYERGKADLTVAIGAQATGNLTRTRYYQSILEYQTALADLEKAIGIPLTT